MDMLGSFCAIVSEILSVIFCLKVTYFISSRIHEMSTLRQEPHEINLIYGEYL